MKVTTAPVLPVGYRAELRADILLADGRVAGVRPILPSDLACLKSLHTSLSSESIYLRFFSFRRDRSEAEFEHLVNVDYLDRLALVAVVEEELVAVARYDRTPATAEAEVAFTVRDDLHGRGIGTVLLEHLASAAFAVGVRRLVADTLAENHRMLDVFRKAGFEEHATFEAGVVRVTIDLEAGAHYLDVVEERDRKADVASIARLLRPSSIAVVGASQRHGTVGRELLANLVGGGFNGPLYPVNPSGGQIAGMKAFSSISEVPESADLAVIAVPASQVAAAVEACGQRAVGGIVVLSAGFAETGPEGAVAERHLVAIAHRHGMRLIGPNCMGVINTAEDISMNATFAPVAPIRGHIAFASQSGGLGTAVLNDATRRDLGVSSFVSVGNKADVSGNDLLRYWEEDAETDVILLYLESFGNPRHFSRISRRIARKKPIVAVKSGRDRSGTPGASPHAAAVAASDPTFDALFRQAGIIRVDTLEELLDVADVLKHQPLPQGRAVAIVGNAGGPGVLAADACEGYGLSVPQLSAETQKRLRSVLSPVAAVVNPVDCIASATADQYRQALEIVLADAAVDAAIVIFTPPLATQADDVAEAVAAVAARATKPIVATFFAIPGAVSALRASVGRVPWFAYPESAARALAHIVPYASWRQRPDVAPPPYGDIDTAGGRVVVEDALGASVDSCLGAEATGRLLTAYGIPHLCSEGAAVTVPTMAPLGVETIVALFEDVSFGPVVMFGLGGVASEVLGDRALSLTPLSRPDAIALIGSLRSARLLTGYRGSAPVDVDALADVFCRVARLADDLPEIVEMELNPVLAGPEGCRVLACKVRVRRREMTEPLLRRRHLG